MQQGIRFQYISILQFCENSIKAICSHFVFIASFINILKNIFKLVTNPYLSIINYKTIYKLACHKVYILFYNNVETKNKMYFVDHYYYAGQSSFQGQNRFYKGPQNKLS